MQMKPLTLVLTVLFQLLSLTAFAQKNAGLNSLLDKNSEFIFPQTPDKISSVLKTKTQYYEDANEEKYAKWVQPSGLELYCSLGENNNINEMSFEITDDHFVIVDGLPFGLVINKTTLKESAAKFSKYGGSTEKLGRGTEYEGGAKLTFKKGKHYAILIFDSKDLLKSLYLTTQRIDPAAN
ncbi:hypothetical protein SAMN02787073_3902 [Chryseobacterium vrystaatense]|uniref:Beta-lactamase-inhibitor-like, PepSY-like n=2 Tax=Chryseobacterium vrystaatense TaxID=307480 RepID=A0A1M5IKG0_9FLAO|nr:hypothetical protein SAMN02787073_3902 [Chryseobacterium vrystaatense]